MNTPAREGKLVRKICSKKKFYSLVHTNECRNTSTIEKGFKMSKQN